MRLRLGGNFHAGHIPGVDARVRTGGPAQGLALQPTLALGDAVGSFKSVTTDEYIIGVRQREWPRFRGRFWQRNYYEHVIRDEDELGKIREYIRLNPMIWTVDRYNSENSGLVIDESGRVVPWSRT